MMSSAFNAGCETPRALHLVGTNTNVLGTQLKDQLAQNTPPPGSLILTKCIRSRSKDVREI